MLFARLYARVDILLTCQAASFHWERKFELMRLIQSRNILLTCQEIERSCICVLHARYRFCFSLQCFYWIKGNVPTVWYLCSDSVVFVFRQCGICVPTVWYLCSDSGICVPTVWYLCSDSVVFVFRQCGICVPTVWYLCSDSVVFVFRQCGICVPTVWYLCSDSVVFVFRQCGIGFWFSFHFWKNPIFGSSPKNASHCIQSYTVKHG